MNAKQKAEELMNKVSAFKWATYPKRKKVSLMIVEEIIQNDKSLSQDGIIDEDELRIDVRYWESVQEEIQKL